MKTTVELTAACHSALWELLLIATALDSHQLPESVTPEDKAVWDKVLDIEYGTLPYRAMPGDERPPEIIWHIYDTPQSVTLVITPNNIIHHVGAIWMYVRTVVLTSAHPRVKMLCRHYGHEIDLMEHRYISPRSGAELDEYMALVLSHNYPVYRGSRPLDVAGAMRYFMGYYLVHNYLMRNQLDAVQPDQHEPGPMDYRFGMDLPTMNSFAQSLLDIYCVAGGCDPSTYAITTREGMRYDYRSLGRDLDYGEVGLADIWREIRATIIHARSPAVRAICKHFNAEKDILETMYLKYEDSN